MTVQVGNQPNRRQNGSQSALDFWSGITSEQNISFVSAKYLWLGWTHAYCGFHQQNYCLLIFLNLNAHMNI